MALGHRLLHRVQMAVCALQTLDALERLAVQCGQELQTTVDRQVIDSRARFVEFANQHHTGAAIALSAAFLGSIASQVLAQIVQYGGAVLRWRSFNDGAVKDKTHSMMG